MTSRGPAHGPHVAIDARLVPGKAGGVEQALIQLVSALAGLTDGDETYTIIVDQRSPNWLAPYVGPNQRIVVAPDHHAVKDARLEERLAALCWQLATPAARVLSPVWRKLVIRRRRRLLLHAQLRSADGIFVPLGARVVHVPYQRLVHTSLPVIFEPWDLQHHHLPEFFSADDQAERDLVYGRACLSASAVVVGSDWVAADLTHQLAVPRQKIFRVRRGPPVAHYQTQLSNDAILEVRARLALPDSFVFFPAQTWPHKNHLRLLEAIALLRDRDGVRVPVVCSGTLTEHYRVIRQRLNQLGLEKLVRFLGYVPPDDMRALYRVATVLAVPSLFEGYGFPVLEAFHESLACTCSDVTSLAEMAGGAAILFDPRSTKAIADAILDLWVNPDLRRTLADRGRERLKSFDDHISARTFRALYRRVSGFPINMDDQRLLEQALNWRVEQANVGQAIAGGNA
jgi:glycosyltransferase involved in cell wall biosynthesis